jgi:hypothetical protein
MPEIRDEFLSEEDLDLAALSFEELEAWWNSWLEQAQITNEEDRYEYSHGVFTEFSDTFIK